MTLTLHTHKYEERSTDCDTRTLKYAVRQAISRSLPHHSATAKILTQKLMNEKEKKIELKKKLT